MNYHSMMENYKSTNTFTKVEDANKHDSIKIVLRGFIKEFKNFVILLEK